MTDKCSIAINKLASPIPNVTNAIKLNGCFLGDSSVGIAQSPITNENTKNGINAKKIARHPNALETTPPNVGPIGGASAVVIAPIPMTVPC